MRSIYHTLMCVALLMVACQTTSDTVDDDTEQEVRNITMKVIASERTRTVLDRDNQRVCWSEGDKIVVVENDDRYRLSDDVSIDDDGRATFEVSFAEDATTDHFFYDAIYPAENVVFDGSVSGELFKVLLPAEQHPSTSSFDPKADILVAERLNFSSQPTTLEMRFKRLVAMCALTLKGLPAGSSVAQVTFTTDGDTILAGYNLVDSTEGRVFEYGCGDGSSSITLKYDTPHSPSEPLYFTSNPLTLREGEQFTLEVVCSDGATYRRSVTIPDGRSLRFVEGDLALFTVDMSTAVDDGKYHFRRVKSVTDGKAYLIAAEGYVAMPRTDDYGYLQVAVGDDDGDGEIIVDNLDNAFIFEVATGGYKICQHYDDRYLYQKSNYNSFNLSASPSSGYLWSVSYNGDNTFTIKNTSVSKFIQYNSQYNSFGSYASFQSTGYCPMLYELDGELSDDTPDDTPEDTPGDAPDEDWLELPAKRTDGAYPDAVTVTVMDGSERNYTHYYDCSTYTSLWVAYPLESKHMGSYSRPTSWDWNPYISTAEQVDLRSRSYSGNYSRGHLIPNASRNGIRNMQLQTFYVTNSVPQVQDNFNGGIWQNLEAALQSIGKSKKIYIVTGVAFEKKGESKSVSYTTAKDDTKRVPIPNYFYKVVLKVNTNSSGVVTEASTVGFWFENKAYTNSTYSDHTTSVDQIEAWTGFDFFANLPDSVEAAAEKNSSWNTFQSF